MSWRGCPHNVTDIDPETGEEYCVACGEVIDVALAHDPYEDYLQQFDN